VSFRGASPTRQENSAKLPHAAGAFAHGREVVILSWEEATSPHAHAAQIAEFLGADASIVVLREQSILVAIREALSGSSAAIVDIDTIAELRNALGIDWKQFLLALGSSSPVFLYGFRPCTLHGELVRELSNEALVDVREAPASNFLVAGGREDCAQFSGVTVCGLDRSRDACFVEGKSSNGRMVLIHAGGEPFCVRLEHAGRTLFFVACTELADPNEKTPQALLPWFSRLVPLMLFLRRAMGKRLWHSSQPQACLIVDDPTLKSSYGFLHYSALLRSMQTLSFSSAIAFIPWNYRRSRSGVAKHISTGPGSLSVCIHGCDHTSGEFDSWDSAILHAKAQTALHRMAIHEQLTGVPFDDVMIFPQGRFSAEALHALHACGYLAAVNTSVLPTGARGEGMPLRELLDVAVTRFDGFPLFARHYPRDFAEFAFDLFLGKPAFVVEHHGYFRDGCGELENFVQQLNKLDDRLRWQNLAAICSTACLQRNVGDDEVQVRFYTNRFRITNDSAIDRRYALVRNWPGEKPLPLVTCNGVVLRAEHHAGSIAINFNLHAGETVGITLAASEPAPAAANSWSPGRRYRFKAFARRALSEVRDEYVDTSPLLSRMLTTARNYRARKEKAKPPL